MGAADFAEIRSRFPILQRQVNGKELIYLDSAASAQKPQEVLDVMARSYDTHYANVHRGLHTLSEESTDAYEAVRTKVAGLIGAASAGEIIFTSGATMALNLIAWSWGRQNLSEGDEILITMAEHHANIIPWQLIGELTGAKLVAAPMGPDGSFDIAAFKERIGKRTRIISVPHVSNVLGTVYPVAEIAWLARQAGAISVIDGCQGVIHMPVDVQEIGCDFYAFSGHKLYGPSGIGVLWGRADLLADMPPFLGGGDMIDEVAIEGSSWAAPPVRFEAGTPPIVPCIGLGAAVDFVQSIGMDALRRHEQDILSYGQQRLAAVKGLNFIGTAAGKSGVISFTLEAAHPHDIATLIDQDGVAVRAGHHCAQPLMKELGISSCVRASVAVYSRAEDFDRLGDALDKVNRIFRA